MKIPFVDLNIQYKLLKKDIDAAIQSVIDRTAFIKGEEVEEFEKSFAKLYGVKHCIGVANGTDALYIAMKMLGVGPGDEVITVSNSWISTSETIVQTGAKPVFVDIDEYSTIDVTKIEEKINENTIAIIPVHLYGQPADMKAIKAIAEKYQLYLIEDCAQSHFAEFEGKKTGTFGDVATFSFYPGKNLGAYGDAGAIITNDDELANKMRMYANHGALKKHVHITDGINSRLDTIQAAILKVKLPYIFQWNEMRLKNARYYDDTLEGVGDIITPAVRKNVTPIYHVYSIRTRHRDDLMNFLTENGIGTAIHYPVALPFMETYNWLNHKPEEFPRAYQFQHEILSLPMYPELKIEMMNYVAEVIKLFFKKREL
ncbi:MAG: DegT/DnrJ/EryC1/StrS family aminotransferase [Bacteroidales bacterium]